MFVVACRTTGLVRPPAASVTATPTISPGPTLTSLEQIVVAEIGASYGSDFYLDRSQCIQAIDQGTATECIFLTDIEQVTKPEWEQLLPGTTFYLIDIGGWRSKEDLLPHETQDSGTRRYLAIWQDGHLYPIDKFSDVLEINSILVADSNRELVARSFALLTIPNFLGGEVKFLEWAVVPSGTYRHSYSHSLRAWTEVWGCELQWWFVFDKEILSIASLQGKECYSSDHGAYIEDKKHFRFGDEAVPLDFPPGLTDFYLGER